jgi:hypothetical protein
MSKIARAIPVSKKIANIKPDFKKMCEVSRKNNLAEAKKIWKKVVKNIKRNLTKKFVQFGRNCPLILNQVDEDGHVFFRAKCFKKISFINRAWWMSMFDVDSGVISFNELSTLQGKGEGDTFNAIIKFGTYVDEDDFDMVEHLGVDEWGDFDEVKGSGGKPAEPCKLQPKRIFFEKIILIQID